MISPIPPKLPRTITPTTLRGGRTPKPHKPPSSSVCAPDQFIRLYPTFRSDWKEFTEGSLLLIITTLTQKASDLVLAKPPIECIARDTENARVNGAANEDSGLRYLSHTSVGKLLSTSPWHFWHSALRLWFSQQGSTGSKFQLLNPF